MSPPAAAANPGAGRAFAELLLHHRHAVGLSQKQLARRAGLSERAVRDLERGAVARPRRGSVDALAAGLRLSGDDASAFVAAATAAYLTPPAAVVSPPRHPPNLSRPPTAASDPYPPADLIGRRAELRALVDLVTGARHRIVTVTGPAGIGKSRLVAAVVAVVATRTGSPVHHLDLSGLGDFDLVGEVIAEAIGPPGSWRSAPVDRIAARLRQQRTLLVLDCFERLVEAAPVVAAMVRRCPGLTVLTTSQRPLELAGERRLTLGPLPLDDAVDLFARRAAAAAPGFAVTPHNAMAIRAICRAVDGLPLAVELAAARMRMLTAGELAARLDRPLQVLTGGSRDAPDRHRSLRSAIESSLELIDDRARTLLAWMAPFPGGVRLTDLEWIVGRLTGDEGWVLGAVSELVDTGVIRIRAEGTHSRYLLPDAVRQLADERLAARDDDRAVRAAVARRYMLRLQAAATTTDGAGYTDLDAELDNVRAAVDWVQTHHPAALDTATAQTLYRFHDLHGRYGEGRTTLVRLARAGVPGAAWALVGAASFSRLLKDVRQAADLVVRAEAVMRPTDHTTRAAAELLRGNVAADGGDMPVAAAHCAAAADAARRAGDEQTLGRALNNLGGIALVRGELTDAERYYRESLAVRRRAGAPDRDLGLTLMNLADLERTGRRWSAAIRHAREAAELLDRAGHPRSRGMALSTLAMAALHGGVDSDLDTAVAAIEEAIGLLPAFGDDKPMHAIIRARHSVVLHACGRAHDAFAALADAVETMTGTLAQFEIAPIIEAHAALLAERNPVAAAQLLGLAEAVRDNQEHAQPPLLQPPGVTGAVCRTRLDAVGFARAHRSGTNLYRHGLADALAELLHAMAEGTVPGEQ